jgi:hypothetical protein
LVIQGGQGPCHALKLVIIQDISAIFESTFKLGFWDNVVLSYNFTTLDPMELQSEAITLMVHYGFIRKTLVICSLSPVFSNFPSTPDSPYPSSYLYTIYTYCLAIVGLLNQYLPSALSKHEEPVGSRFR